MKDEEYVFRSDSRDKAITARSARHTRTHCGKGGRVRLPSDNLTKKELQKMNGEVKSYRLNSPMRWAEYKSMPDDLKIAYIKALRNKYNVPDVYIAEMLGVGRQWFIKEVSRIGLNRGKSAGGRMKWDKDGFYAWVNGVDMVPAPVAEEEPVEAPVEVPVIEEAPVHFCEAECEAVSDIGCESSYVEDDLPYEDPDLSQAELVGLRILVEELKKVNEELAARHEKDKDEKECLRYECDRQRMRVQILEAQMDVVRMIFGGKNHG